MPTHDSRLRYRLPIGLVAALFVAAALTQTKLQTAERAHTLYLADQSNRFMVRRTDFAKRGAIYSADGKPIAKDDETFELGIDFRKVPHSTGFWMDLSEATGIAAADFQAFVDAKAGSRTWTQPLSLAQKEAVDNVRSAWRADGVSVARSGKREYLLGEAASGLVGARIVDQMVVRPGEKGYRDLLAKGAKPRNGVITTDLLYGLEKSYDDTLRGENGLRKGLTDKNGSFLPMREVPGLKKRRDGEDITLTIDSDLQMEATRAIREAVEKNKATSGSAIMIDPKTGDILAMANWPSFKPFNDDGTPGDMSAGTGFNASYMSALEPGSTFKILTLAKALDEGKVTMNDHLTCEGRWKFGPYKPVICDEGRAHHDVDPTKAIAESCNIAASHWSLAVGYNDYTQFLKDLGLSSKPNLGLPGEIRSRFYEGVYARPLTVATLGYGQAINTTPVSLAGAFAMLGNKGVYMSPRLIKRVGNKEQPIAQGKAMLKPETATTVIQCMEAVIDSEHGTGKALRVPGYRLAGKTGTAQRIGGGKTGHVGNFVGFVPAVDPKALILVMVDNPKGGNYHGAAVAGPVFVDLARATIRRFNLPPTESIEVKTKANGAQRQDHPAKPLPEPKRKATGGTHDA